MVKPISVRALNPRSLRSFVVQSQREPEHALGVEGQPLRDVVLEQGSQLSAHRLGGVIGPLLDSAAVLEHAPGDHDVREVRV